MSEIDRRSALTRVAALAATPWLATHGQVGHAAQVKKETQTKKADPYADAKLIDGEPPAPAKDSFTVVLLPDTQNYSEKYPETYLAQTRWIAENQTKRNIRWVLHLGDITNNSTKPEWENAARAMQVLDDARIPYVLCPGNHDYSKGGRCSDRTTLLNDYFPVSRFEKREGFGGTYDKEPTRMENSYQRFTVGTRKFLILALEFGPRADVIRWGNEIVARHKDHEAILITHALIYSDDTRYDFKKYGNKQSWNPHVYEMAKATKDDVADGEELWQKLISKHENFILTFNGHVLNDGLGKVTTQTPGQRDVHQVLVNYQMRPKGGDGWLRLLEFQADQQTVEVYDYSPTRQQRNEGKENRFNLKLAPVKA